MADYLKKFATQAEYDAYIQAGYPKPNVSYIEDTDETIFTNYKDGEAGPEYILDSVKIADFTGTTFSNYSQYVTEVYVPEGVTATANFAFGTSSTPNYINIEKITVPTTLATVGPGTFSYNQKLKTVEGLKDTAVTRLPHFTNTLYNNGMFAGCTSLESIELPSGLTSIDQYTFYRCTSLESIEIPSLVTSIGDNCFSSCTALTSVSLPSNLTSIIQNAFNPCPALPSVDIPASVTSIGDYAFYNCKLLTSVTVRATTPPTLGTNAFSNTHANLVIYVPAESVEAYKAASGWSTYASRIQAIPA